MLDPRDMDLNLLVVFNEIFQEQQISGVAKRLNLSQPAVSNALARLRRTFDDALFVRTRDGMQPTPFAEQLAEPIRQALNSLTDALNRQEAFDASTSTRCFQMALTDVAELYFMPRLIQHCTSQAPGVTIRTRRTTRLDLMSEMGSGRIDLAIGAFKDVSDALFQRRLFKQPYVILMRDQHALAAQTLTLKRYLSAQHLMVDSGESPHDRINLDLEKAGVMRQVKFSVPHFTSVPYIIANSDLLATVPQKLAGSVTQPFSLTYRPAPLRLPDLQTNIFWHRRFNQDQGNVWLRTLVGEIFSE